MNLDHNSHAPHDVDLQRTRRTFLFAREQIAANSSAGPYVAAREMRLWAQGRGRGAHSATDAPDGTH